MLPFSSLENILISKVHIDKEIQNIDLETTINDSAIPPNILKESCNTFVETLQNVLNQCLITGDFPDNLKLADITPAFKKKYHINKENFRSINVLPSISKNFEKPMQKQINGQTNHSLPPYLGCYRISFRTHLAL